MREIKFRAWDGKRMRVQDDFIITYDGPAELVGEYGLGVRTVNWELMQYTGLKDKNGKEIYEGDIVIYKYLSGFACDDDYDDAHANNNTDKEEGESYYGKPKLVKFRNGEFWPREYYDCCDDGFYSSRTFDLIVIGNIHENPELLANPSNS